MYISVIFLVIFFALPTVVTACEGECIVEITKAFLTNYTYPVNSVLQGLVRILLAPLSSNSTNKRDRLLQNNEVIADIHPDRKYSSPPFLMEPVLSTYQNEAYTRLKTAIFPSYFHGKCQRPDSANPDGPWVNPDGCPNPDCPVVCGTPGSLVHFYPKLRYIAYNNTRHHLQALATPGTKAYQETESNYLREAAGGSAYERRKNSMGGTRMPRIRRQEQAVKRKLREVMRRVSSEMEKACGGTGTGKLNGLQRCSWETRMKEFILTFP
ncbi:hypothetical protein H0H87_009407 [Tephrocybe sp. NHM501043]|nr:hypothetical protein H0H87_009407 [Tephrocybe sp. NHM501043]